MFGEPLKRSNLEKYLDTPWHLIRRWVEDFEPLASKPRKGCCATPFSPADLRFLFVVKALTSAGMAPKALAKISSMLYERTEPSVAPRKGEVLTLRFDGQWHIGDPTSADDLSMTVPLWKIRDQADACIGTQRPESPQRPIPFSPRAVGGRR